MNDTEKSDKSSREDERQGVLVFYIAAGLNWLGAMVLLALAAESGAMGAMRPLGLALAAALILAGCIFLVIPAIAAARTNGLLAFRASLLDLNARWADLEAVRREHYKAKTASESLADSLTQESQRLLAIQKELQGMFLERRSMDDEILRQRQAAGNLTRRIESWENSSMDFIRAMERVIEGMSGLPPEAAKAYRKSADDFARFIEPLGVALIRPAAGDAFDDRIHRIEGEEASTSVAAGHVLRGVAWGFRLSNRIEHARVVLAKSPTEQECAGLVSTAGKINPVP